MATRYDAFQLILYYREKGETKETVIALTQDIDALQQGAMKYSVSVKENTNYKLRFTSEDTKARLYIEGIKDVEGCYYDEEKDQWYLSPNTELFEWVKYGVTQKNIIPGNYYIKVVCGGTIYYGILKVESKHLEEYQLEQMKKEVQSFIGNWKKIPEGIKESIEEKIFHKGMTHSVEQIDVLMKWHEQLMSLIHDFTRNPEQEIEKVYQYTLKNQGRKIDQTAIKMNLRKSGDSQKHYAYTKNMTYDIQENRWLKNFNERLLKLISQFQQTQQPLEVAEMLKRMMAICRNLRNSVWYKEIRSNFYEELPIKSRYDSRYRLLAECDYELWKSGKSKQLKTNKELLWLETSIVYEFWCFMQVYNTLKEDHGYRHIGYVKSGYALEKGDIRLKLYYDKKIPINRVETSSEYPLYARGNHSRQPDGRIDIYKKKEYCGSIILEVKYSNPHNVWNEDRDTRNSRQILNYGYQLATKHLEGPYKNLPEAIKNQINPIHKVLVIMPKLMRDEQEIEDDATNIVQVGLRPGKKSNVVERYIQSI